MNPVRLVARVEAYFAARCPAKSCAGGSSSISSAHETARLGELLSQQLPADGDLFFIVCFAMMHEQCLVKFLLSHTVVNHCFQGDVAAVLPCCCGCCASANGTAASAAFAK